MLLHDPFLMNEPYKVCGIQTRSQTIHSKSVIHMKKTQLVVYKLELFYLLSYDYKTKHL